MNRKISLVLLLLAVVAFVGEASAFPGFLKTFEGKYGPAVNGSRIDNCLLCHVSASPVAGDPSSDRNPYGLAFQNNGETAAALTTIEPLDSDGDGFINIDEIHNLTFPGNASDHPVTITPTPAATFNISGFKINNVTGSGVQGWNITLKNTTMQTSMLTGADGSYKFMNLVNGTYNVSEELQAGWTNVSPMSQQVTINGADIENINFTNQPPAIVTVPTFNISGFKINNVTGSGVQGWNITLKNTTMQTNMLTGADGSYKFMNLVNGTYNVSEELQAGWTNVSPMSQQVTINGADMKNINFTNQPPTPVGTFNISGFKVNDTNGNGVWDPGEMGIGNWKIMLLNDTGVQLANTSTDASGFYQFMNIFPGDYNVAEEMKPGFTSTNATSMPVTVENMDVMNVNFTNQVTVTPKQTFNISGFKVNDTNGNNVWEPGEMGIENWNIMLLNDTGAQIASTSTNASGFYEFMDLAPGVYNVTEEMKAGFTPSGATFKVVTIENMDVTDVDFLNHVTVQPAVTNIISGFKINDLNGNGKQDPGENGLPGWNIRLIGIVPETVSINEETTTDDKGFYSFENLPAGMYLVVETLKGGYVPSGPPVLVVTLENGKNSMNNNFMNRPISSLIPDLSGLFK